MWIKSHLNCDENNVFGSDENYISFIIIHEDFS